MGLKKNGFFDVVAEKIFALVLDHKMAFLNSSEKTFVKLMVLWRLTGPLEFFDNPLMIQPNHYFWLDTSL